jgi:hypothetical protein
MNDKEIMEDYYMKSVEEVIEGESNGSRFSRKDILDTD